MSEWIDAKRDLPPSGDEVLVFVVKSEGVHSAWHDEGSGWRDPEGIWPYGSVSHWMPLPVPPTASQKGE